MGSFRMTLGMLHEELGNLVGVRTGLAWSESHLEPFIEEVAPELLIGAVGVRMHASTLKGLMFRVLQASGDPRTSMGYMPRLSLIMDIDEQRYVIAADLLHQEIHRQGLGDDGFGYHEEGEHCRLVVLDRATEEAVARLGCDPSTYAAASINDIFISRSKLSNLDEGMFLGEVMISHGKQVREDCAAMLQAYRCEQHLDPWRPTFCKSVSDLLTLSSLFEECATTPPSEKFIDQRLINYLYANLDAVSTIHWRQFERLVAEYLSRQGYFVELGPGRNDDNIDIRMWPVEPQLGQPPLVIVQCKRTKEKVDKVIVKALWADVQASSSMRGLVATTSAVTPGAASTIKARGYGIDVADSNAISQWLRTMRTPGVGVSLSEE